MGEILSAEAVRSARYRYPDSTTEDGANDVIALGDSHEALRARLAEVEQERDLAIAQGDRYLDEKKAALVERGDAEARLAEVEQALREVIDVRLWETAGERIRRADRARSVLDKGDPS